MKAKLILILVIVHTCAWAQQHHHHHQPKKDSLPADSTKVRHRPDSVPHMNHSFSLSLPMSRNGSGTAWLPDASLMYGHGYMGKRWMLMFHGNLFLRYNRQDVTGKGSRGGEKFDAPNWLMLMGQRKAGKRGLLHISGMFSLDPLSVGGEGYPLLFQTGETYQGNPLIDRQHPHDLFSELALAYTHRVSENTDITAYFGYPGEPALGPVAFMHRLSALNNPDAPLGHHWQDATHITFGVATLGVRLGKLKLEGSSFTGREPDENRYDLDRPRFDSYSFRVLFNPTGRIALQASGAFVRSPDALEPDENVRKTTASAIYHLPLSMENRYFSSALVWGYNKSDHGEHSLLIEPVLQLDRTAVYGRYEWVQKPGEELGLHQFNGHGILFPVQAITLGINQTFVRAYGNNLALGLQGSLFIADKRLNAIYGEYPMSAEVYIRFSPHLMHHHGPHQERQQDHSGH
ncbi:MAG: hypothetical protein AB1458_14925 [Bacteroidota bacterium]